MPMAVPLQVLVPVSMWVPRHYSLLRSSHVCVCAMVHTITRIARQF